MAGYGIIKSFNIFVPGLHLDAKRDVEGDQFISRLGSFRDSIAAVFVDKYVTI